MSFADSEQPGDWVGEFGGVKVFVDPQSAPVLQGVEVDWIETLQTTGFAIPAILEWQGPVVATSIKTDLLRETLAARSAIAGAQTYVYDPTGSTGLPSAGWTPRTCRPSTRGDAARGRRDTRLRSAGGQ